MIQDGCGNMRAQAAMEYLTTYGWAIMALVVVMGGIAYFGFGSINDYIPQSCEFPEPLLCEDFFVSEEEISLLLTNIGKDTLLFSKMNVSHDGEFAGEDCGDLRYVDGTVETEEFLLVEPGQSFEMICNNDLFLPEQAKIDVEYVQKLVDGFPRKREGMVISNLN